MHIIRPILAFSFLFSTLATFAQPNYQYVILQPGQSYINTTNQSQQIQIVQQQDIQNYAYQQPAQQTANYSYTMPNERQQNASIYDKTRNTMTNATSTVNDAVSLIRTLQSLKYSY